MFPSPPLVKLAHTKLDGLDKLEIKEADDRGSARRWLVEVHNYKNARPACMTAAGRGGSRRYDDGVDGWLRRRHSQLWRIEHCPVLIVTRSSPGRAAAWEGSQRVRQVQKRPTLTLGPTPYMYYHYGVRSTKVVLPYHLGTEYSAKLPQPLRKVRFLTWYLGERTGQVQLAGVEIH